jgi:hypothetical protein
MDWKMSNITNIYTNVLTKLAALHPLKARIPNPYSLPDNNDNFLISGYGLKVGGSTPIGFENDSFVNQRIFSVVYTYEATATNSDTDVPDDISLKLLEDVYEAQRMFFAEDKMGIPEILSVDLGSCSEIAPIGTGRKFLSIEVSFTIAIRENL